MCQSNYLEVSRAALRKNAVAVCEAVKTPVIGIIKCNGYGVTACEAAAAWQAAGVELFGVSRPEEALALRRAGFQEDILLLCPVSDVHTLKQLLEHRVILTVSGFENAQLYSIYAPKERVRVHLAIDTGMGRFGIRWNDEEQARAVYSLPGLAFEGIFSHFCHAYEKKYRDTRLQLNRFLYLVQRLQRAGCEIGMRHIANSCAAMRFPETRLDAVRIGSALVGRLPVPVPVELEKVGVFNARVIDCKWLEPGEQCGYGGACRIKKHTYAAIVALGQEDGFGLCGQTQRHSVRQLVACLRQIFHGWRHPLCVVFDGEVLPLLGYAGNQYAVFDATDTGVKPGDWVQWDGHILRSSCERRFI